MYASSMTSAFVPDSAIARHVRICVLINLFKANDTDSYNSYHVSGAKLAGHLMISIMLIFGLNIASGKFQTPYSWWGYTLPNATIGKVQSPIEDIRPQKLDYATAGALAKITKAVARYSVSNNDVLFYPHIPMQYQIQGKTPPTDSIVHWFDVISSDVMSKDFAKLKRTPPKVVVIFDPPYQTYLGHMDFKRSQLIQQDFLAWMTEMQSAGTYKLVEYGYHGSRVEERRNEEIRVTNFAFAQLSAKEQFEQIRGKCSGYVSEVIDDRAKFNLEINLALKDIENLDSFSFNDDENTSWIKLNLDAKVRFVDCTVPQYEELVEIIGSIDKRHEHTYRLKIFVRDAAVSQIEG